ncbi:MAG TPA: hemerythrin domain-containing protein [Acidimicrobiales bacterium]|nr:hemerythrin domain-containing protein [Acidimicrobiales bacterium]
MDVLEHLTHEHRTAESLVEQLRDTEPGTRRAELFGELVDSLHRHMAVEERFLYPIVERVLGAEDGEEADVEHELLRDALGSAQELVDGPGFGAALEMVHAAMAHHVEEEEGEMFPALRSSDAAGEIAALDPDELEARVESESGDVTRDELYEQARAADVSGRSSMTKDELKAALDG